MSAAASTAAAQAPPRAAARPACPPLFSSPAGEPFRFSDGDAQCPMRVWFDQADADHDGALSRTEFRQDALRFFDILDVNGDGVIGPAELKRYEQVIFPEIAFGDRLPPLSALDTGVIRVVYAGQVSGGGQSGNGGGFGRSASGDPIDMMPHGQASRETSSLGAGQFGLLEEPEPVIAADLNFDGRVSRPEFAERADQRFDTLDTAQTGSLAFADLQARMPKGRGGRRRR